MAPLLAVLGDLIIDQVRHGGAVLRKEVLHVDQEVLDDRHAAQRLNGDALAGVLDEVLAGEPIAPVDEHRIRSAHAVGARASEGQRSVAVPLHLVQEVEHAVRRLGLQRVLLPVRLLVELGVVAADAELDVHRPQ